MRWRKGYAVLLCLCNSPPEKTKKLIHTVHRRSQAYPRVYVDCRLLTFINNKKKKKALHQVLLAYVHSLVNAGSHQNTLYEDA